MFKDVKVIILRGVFHQSLASRQLLSNFLRDEMSQNCRPRTCHVGLSNLTTIRHGV